MNKARITALSGIVLAVAASRLLPHPPNVSPIAAMALFGGAYFDDKRLAFIIPLVCLFLSDLFIGFHSTIPFVYGSFILIACIGFLLKKRTVPGVVIASLSSSILFFVITNFGVWMTENLYPKTFAGLGACYIAGIPFFRNTLIGDFVYVAILFGGMELLTRAFPKLAET